MGFSSVIFVCNAAKVRPCWMVHCVKRNGEQVLCLHNKAILITIELRFKLLSSLDPVSDIMDRMLPRNISYLCAVD
jgi:hypothetical protein